MAKGRLGGWPPSSSRRNPQGVVYHAEAAPHPDPDDFPEGELGILLRPPGYVRVLLDPGPSAVNKPFQVRADVRHTPLSQLPGRGEEERGLIHGATLPLNSRASFRGTRIAVVFVVFLMATTCFEGKVHNA